MFGRGSTSGVINSISKQPLLTPLAQISVSGGEADYWRGTGTSTLPLGGTAAARITVMDQKNEVVDRDQVLYRRYGVAPTLSLGVGTPTRSPSVTSRRKRTIFRTTAFPSSTAHPPRSIAATTTRSPITIARVPTPISAPCASNMTSPGDITLSDSLRYANYGFEIPGHRALPRQRLRGAPASGYAL